MFFLDTNILVYSIDPEHPREHAIARNLHRVAIETREGVVSSQVVQEFCSVALKKFQKKIHPDDLSDVVQAGLLPLMQHAPSREFYTHALTLCRNDTLSFYDALIVQAALDLGCDILYSEDLQDGRKFGKMTIKNPFKE